MRSRSSRVSGTSFKCEVLRRFERRDDLSATGVSFSEAVPAGTVAKISILKVCGVSGPSGCGSLRRQHTQECHCGQLSVSCHRRLSCCRQFPKTNSRGRCTLDAIRAQLHFPTCISRELPGAVGSTIDG